MSQNYPKYIKSANKIKSNYMKSANKIKSVKVKIAHFSSKFKHIYVWHYDSMCITCMAVARVCEGAYACLPMEARG